MKIYKIEKATLIIATIIYGCLTFITLIAEGGIETGTIDSSNTLMSTLAEMFNIFRFPTHTLFFNHMNEKMFFIGLLINCIFYGFVTERIISFSKQHKNSGVTK